VLLHVDHLKELERLSNHAGGKNNFPYLEGLTRL
jgi:hypothetical protein